MLVYFNQGFCKYSNGLFPTRRRDVWEFQCSFAGQMIPILPEPETVSTSGEPTLWVFPPGHAHGWSVAKQVERLVFHFTAVPGEIENHVPPRGYYQAALEANDCDRLRELGAQALELGKRPTKLLFLQTRTLVGELSLMALWEAVNSSLSPEQIARNRTERALAFYSQHMSEYPSIETIAEAIHMSPTHLRRLFHKVRDESPKKAFNRLRMEKAEQFLRETHWTLEMLAAQLGFSCSSAFSRAVKAHFGKSPIELRRETRPIRSHRGIPQEHGVSRPP